MSCIRFEAVEKSFGGIRVLDDFSLEVAPATMKILLGAGGSGKSTVLKMVPGLVRPDRGRVEVLGEAIEDLSEDELMPLRGRIGMVFQAGALFDSMTVGENVAYRLYENRLQTEEEIRSVVEEVLGFVGLEHTANKFPSELSGGMRRRVAIARALVGHPEIMLYDEPTAGLDPITSRTICELIMKLRDLEKVTSLLVTTDLSTMRNIASETARRIPGGGIEFQPRGPAEAATTEIVMIEGGRVLLQGTDEEFQASQDPYVREFLD